MSVEPQTIVHIHRHFEHDVGSIIVIQTCSADSRTGCTIAIIIAKLVYNYVPCLWIHASVHSTEQF